MRQVENRKDVNLRAMKEVAAQASSAKACSSHGITGHSDNPNPVIAKVERADPDGHQ